MAIYKLLREGDQGADVEKLQNALIAAGHDVGTTGADGIYGKNTAQAVRDYQTENKLQIDGIAGDETLGMLYGTTLASPSGEGGTAQDVTERASADQALTDLNAHLSTKPQLSESPWGGYMQDYADAFLSRKDFDYDVNEDALYQQLQDQYTAQGRLAMLDTMAQAQAMNGGYGSSYAQSVGQQAYNGYMQSLTDNIPQLYQLARDNYDAKGQALLDKLSLAAQMDDREYDRYTDELSQWLTERGYLRDIYETERSYDYAIGQDNYSKLLDLIAVGYEPTDQDLASAGMTRAQADSVRSAYTQTVAGKCGSSSGSTDSMEMLDYMRLNQLFNKTSNVSELTALRDNMLQMGIDESIVFELYQVALARLRKGQTGNQSTSGSTAKTYDFAKQQSGSSQYDKYIKNTVYKEFDQYLNR